MIYTYIPEQDLKNFQQVLFETNQWDKSEQPELWSQDRIDGSKMYRVNRQSSRVVDESGLRIQEIVYDNYYNKKIIFPYYYQIIKFKNKLNNVKNIEGSICQTFTFLNGEYANNTVVIKPEENFEYETNQNTFVFAISWSDTFNKNDPKTFYNRYYRLFA
jgi:hypothetical protein